MERKQLRFAVRGAPSVAVLALPGSVIAGAEEEDLVEVFCIPIAHRKGGLLLAIPHSIIQEDVLTAGNSSESNDNLIGPSISKVMSSKLEITEADGNITYLEDICGFLVVDFTNEVLTHMQPYDPLFEDYQHVVPFFESLPNAFPSMAGISDKIREWTSETEAPRAVFYSAREEQEGGGKAAAAGSGKKSHQQLIDGRSREPQSPDCNAKSLSGAFCSGEACHSCYRSLRWCKGRGPKIARPLSRPCGSSSPCFKSCFDGWSSPEDKSSCSWKTRCCGDHGRGRTSSRRRTTFCRTRCRSDPARPCPTELSDYIPCRSFGRRSRSYDRPLSLGVRSIQWRHQGSSEERQDDAGLSSRAVKFLHASSTTTSSKAQPIFPCPFHRGGVVCLRCVDPDLLREVWRIPEEQGIGICDVATGPYHRCLRSRRHLSCSGAHSLGSLRCRAGGFGQRRVVFGFPLSAPSGPASPDVPRSAAERDGLWQEFWSSDSIGMGCHQPSFLEGDGSAAEPKDGDKEDQAGCPSQRSRCRIAFAKTKAKISKEAKAGSRGVEGASTMPNAGTLPDASFVPSATPIGSQSKMNPQKHEPGPSGQLGFDFELSFDAWCSHLTVNCLRSRTPFSEFLAKSMRPSCVQCPASSTVFPLPVPFVSPFDRMPKGVSSRVRRKIHFQRAMHCVVMALNFWHSGGDFASLASIHRTPTPVHQAIFSRIRSLLRADGQFPKFRVIGAGRRFPQLIARFGEATEFVIRTGVASTPYSKQFEGVEVDINNSILEELEPYRDADPERIQLKGKDHWDITSFLPDSLCMPYREPFVIFDERVPEVWEFPKIRESPLQSSKIAKLWDLNGLLILHDEVVPKHEWTRIFGCFKDVNRNRQIGDRRGRNACERKVEGPSSQLPAGSGLCDIVLRPSSQCLRILATDRSDFYHQISVSRSRALTNTLGLGFPVDLVNNTKAFDHFVLQSLLKRSRLSHGDDLYTRQPPTKAFKDLSSIISFRSLWSQKALAGFRMQPGILMLLRRPIFVMAFLAPLIKTSVMPQKVRL